VFLSELPALFSQKAEVTDLLKESKLAMVGLQVSDTWQLVKSKLARRHGRRPARMRHCA
jgi:hypothetical protein